MALRDPDPRNGSKTKVQIRKPKDLDRLRRIALASQGLIGRAPFGKGLNGAVKAIAHLGYIQLDSISVIERAHNHVWQSRVPNFRPEQSNELLEDATVFEYWAHAAAYLPMSEYRYYLPDKAAVRAGTLRKGYPGTENSWLKYSNVSPTKAR